jgi:hypothetical protein
MQTDVIRTRQVYYLSGFDARGVRFYHPLYKTQAALQDRVNGTTLSVGEATPTGEHAVTWDIQAHHDGQRTDTRYTFLGWDDVVRDHWPASKGYVARHVLSFYVQYFLCGGVARSWRCSRRFTASILAPLAYAVVALLLAGLVGWGVATGLPRSLPLWPSAWNAIASAIAFCAVGWAALWWAERSRLLWLARGWIFIHRWGQRDEVALSARWQALAQHIATDEAAANADEILLIGHSAGTMAVVSVLSELLAMPQGQALVPKLRLMTLGHVVPMLAFFPRAQAFRAHVSAVARSAVPWLDFTAPSDPLCMALTDPLTGTEWTSANVAAQATQMQPMVPRVVVRSARFDRMFDAAKHQRLRKDSFLIHFQYLMATDVPVANDYFSITAGPKPLAHWMQAPNAC